MTGGFEPSYRMPAEWEKHEATWLSWPKNETTFPGEVLEEVRTSYVEMIDALTPGEEVYVLVDDEKAERDASSRLRSIRNVKFYRAKTEDVWIRDYGPIFVRNRNQGSPITATKWIFNAWGRKYDDLLQDNENGLVIALLASNAVQTRVVLEGGSIDVNGNGTLLTTKQCLLNKNRNPGLSAGEIEKMLDRFLGAGHVIWLGQGIEGDDTDGHVDDIARFVGESKVICMIDEQSSANQKVLEANFRSLKSSADESGLKLEVVPIHMPRRKIADHEGNRLPASYANFYIGNATVLVPVFDDVNDAKALELIASEFQDRKTLGINCEALVSGFGTIHCVTQQQPA